MSTLQPQQQQQQPQIQPVVYPNPLTKQPSHHHSNDSFGTVFIVLAVIAVLSAVACFLGRLCNRRLVKAPTRPSSNNKQPRHNSKDVPHHHGQTRVNDLSGARAANERGDLPSGRFEGDIEFGFDAKSSSSAPNIGNPNDHHTKPDNISNINSGNIKRSDSGTNSTMRPGSRGHVVFERNGDYAKHHGGGERHDYRGGPRASE